MVHLVLGAHPACSYLYATAAVFEVQLGRMHEHIHDFLLSLQEPLSSLLPLLCKLGVRDAESLLTLAKFHDRDKWLWQVAALCGVGHLQTQILLNGLQGLVAMP